MTGGDSRPEAGTQEFVGLGRGHLNTHVSRGVMRWRLHGVARGPAWRQVAISLYRRRAE